MGLPSHWRHWACHIISRKVYTSALSRNACCRIIIISMLCYINVRTRPSIIISAKPILISLAAAKILLSCFRELIIEIFVSLLIISWLPDASLSGIGSPLRCTRESTPWALCNREISRICNWSSVKYGRWNQYLSWLFQSDEAVGWWRGECNDIELVVFICHWRIYCRGGALLSMAVKWYDKLNHGHYL